MSSPGITDSREHEMSGASGLSRIERQLSITASRPCSARHPGCVHATRDERAHNASMASMSRSAKAR